MIAPVILFLLSASTLAVALLVPSVSELVLLAGPATLASLWLLLATALRRWREGPPAPANLAVIDGSNVMHWRDGTPQIKTLREVIRRLADQGFTPGVVFDANAGYRLSGRYQNDRALARRLGLPKDQVIVVDEGTPADPVLLDAARDLGARVVSNDRFQDWAREYPEVGEHGYLIRGGYQDGKLWLDTD